jgi:Tfp pilus assembly protein PilN
MTIKVDLLPTERRGFRLDPMVIVLFMLVVLSCVGFAFYGQNLTQSIETEKKKIEAEKAKIKECEASKPIIEERRKRLRKLDEQIQVIKNLVHDPQRYGNILQEIGLCMPRNVFINTLSIEPNTQTITFAGSAAEIAGSLPLATISQFIKSLNDSKYFSDANVGAVTSEKGKGFSFSMTVRYDQNAAATLPPGSTDSGQPIQTQPAGGGRTVPRPAQSGGAETPTATPDASGSPAATATPGGSPSPGNGK